MSLLKWLVIVVSMVYFGGLAALYFNRRTMLFPIPPVLPLVLRAFRRQSAGPDERAFRDTGRDLDGRGLHGRVDLYRHDVLNETAREIVFLEIELKPSTALYELPPIRRS